MIIPLFPDNPCCILVFNISIGVTRPPDIAPAKQPAGNDDRPISWNLAIEQKNSTQNGISLKKVAVIPALYIVIVK